MKKITAFKFPLSVWDLNRYFLLIRKQTFRIWIKEIPKLQWEEALNCQSEMIVSHLKGPTR